MTKFIGICSVLGFFFSLMGSMEVYSSEKSLEASVSARMRHNDNIFLTTAAHDSVSSVVITPSLSGVIKERHWELRLNSQLRINQYSNHDLDSNGQLFNLTGQYDAERNIFSISIGHDVTSSLSTASTDFGISSLRVERTAQTVAPRYTRLLTERLVLSLSYSYSDADYANNEDARFIASFTETGSAALSYNWTEKDQVSINLKVSDYTRKDNLGDNRLFDVNLDLDHKFSETLSIDLAIGTSWRNSTNLQTSIRDFFGRTITVPQESNTKTRGITLNLSLNRLFETGSVSVRGDRSTTANSFGGLNEIDKFTIDYNERLSSLWRYSLAASYANIASVSVVTTSADREIVSMEGNLYYSLNRDWGISMSYRYNQRKFKNISNIESTPDSNQLQVGLTYNFPLLSTF